MPPSGNKKLNVWGCANPGHTQIMGCCSSMDVRKQPLLSKDSNDSNDSNDSITFKPDEFQYIHIVNRPAWRRSV